MEPNGVGNIFLEKLKKEVDENLTNDQYSVEELAKNIGMSRSQLHRKLSTATGQSVSQFIREYRLQRGMELLKKGDLTATEVADRIGFGSPTYFNKCFNEYYGFPPGEVKNKVVENPAMINAVATDQFNSASNPPLITAKRKFLLLKIVAAVTGLLIVGAIYFTYPELIGVGFLAKALREEDRTEVYPTLSDNSIAILPFKNLSEDQRNEYFSEGVIE